MAATAKRTDPLVLKPRVRHRAVGDEGVVVHLDNGRVLVVNDVGLRIVELLGSPISRADLSARLADEFEVTMDRAEADLNRFLEQLDTEQVIAIHTAAEAD